MCAHIHDLYWYFFSIKKKSQKCKRNFRSIKFVGNNHNYQRSLSALWLCESFLKLTIEFCCDCHCLLEFVMTISTNYPRTDRNVLFLSWKFLCILYIIWDTRLSFIWLCFTLNSFHSCRFKWNSFWKMLKTFALWCRKICGNE